MVSKSKIKFVKSLQVKKYRKQEQSFVVEGAKSVAELLQSDFEIEWLACSSAFAAEKIETAEHKTVEVTVATEHELAQLSTYQTNNAAIAIVKMKPNVLPDLSNQFSLMLDDLRDPGNLGTIIRTADWFGIKNIIASEETTDFYSPKTISATMGSFCRVNVFYTSLVNFLEQNKQPVYGMVMNGEDVHHVKFKNSGLVIIGNESNGISHEVGQFVQHPITIPKIGKAESLNAAIASGIVLDSILRSKK